MLRADQTPFTLEVQRLAGLRRRRPRRLPRHPRPPRLHRFEQAYAARIGVLLRPLRDLLEERLFSLLPAVARADSAQSRTDDPFDDLSAKFDEIELTYLGQVPESRMARAAWEAADFLNSANQQFFRRQIRTVLGVDPIALEPWLEGEVSAFVRENVSLIKILPTESLSDIEQLVYRTMRQGLSSAEIISLITEQLGRTRVSARLIARDQIGKFNGRLTELRQTQLGVERYTWRTSEDERVRPDHARLDGQVFEWANPPVTVTSGKRAGERNHPGTDIQCRCWADPLLEDLLN